MNHPFLPRTYTPALLCATLLLVPTPGRAQTAEAEVRQVIHQLFDGMRAGDSTMVRAVFDPTARLVTTFTDADGTPSLREGSVDRFVQAVGAPHDEVWDERIWDLDIKVDDNLAAAWMKYAFFAGERFSHCGVNVFVLARRPDGWKTVYLADTRRRGDACEMPPDR
ncbi:nuclear transport factor 2 family protein [Rhodocaloribacter litoris]|uniref:nuclear transport factor 2 family protein n=1 Tax=Rhodocaloribacter litoris TaxID=2558931 RepID=UPI001420188F|nr:nuclear transport factor 2 family protein [Rhodocaloribacter litoris]QXD16073.1 nuclear transport factor 2 family protein [Rhodocaloribacter litoris]